MGESQQSQPKVLLRWSIRERRKAISYDYVVFFYECKFDIELKDDPTFVNQVKQCANLKVLQICMRK